MITDELVKKLISENEYLQVQLQDMTEIIAIREEELGILREKAKKAIETKSNLETAYEELTYLQNVIGKQQQKAEGAASREASMEEEMLASMQLEKEYYVIRNQQQSYETALIDIKQQLGEVSDVYKKLAEANHTIAELESRLDITNEEKELLQYELTKLRKKLDAK